MQDIKELLGIQASCYYARQVAVTCRRGTSVARSLKLLALPQGRVIYIINNIILATNCNYIISPCETNTDQ